MTSEKPVIEAKVYAASDAAGAGGVLVILITWAIGAFLYGVGASAANAPVAIAAVAAPLSLALAYFVPRGLSFLAGYRTPHTPRPDLDRPEVAVRARVDPKEPLPDVPHAEHLQSPAARALTTPAPNPRDLDGDGHDDTTGRFA